MFAVRCLIFVFCTVVLVLPMLDAFPDFSPNPDFGSHFLTNPRVYHAVHKREISSSREAERNLVKKISMVATEIEARQCKDCMIVKNSAMMRYINQVKWIQDCGIFPSTSVYKIFGLCALNYLLGASLVRVIAKGVLGDTKILITDGLSHLIHLSVEIDLIGQKQILDLQLNRDLIPKNYFEKHQKNGHYITKNPKVEDIELCHYNGNIRGVLNSWVAVSTCKGIRGIIYDGKEIHYIETTSIFNTTNSFADTTHVVYKHSDLKSNFTCGLKDDPLHHLSDHEITNAKNRRHRRDVGAIHGPYNANRLSRYIELVLVIDNKEYRALNEDVARVHQHCKDIANIINSLYVPLNIFVALVGVVIWTNYDEFQLESNGDKTLTSFLTYRKEKLVKEHPNDNAQLLTKLQFEGGVVGKALKGPICTYEFSGGVNMDHSNVVGLVATTVAHEMGHNLGMEHDTENNCFCPEGKCIMAPSSSSSSPSEWSSCSREFLTIAFEHGMDYCLRNKPTSLFDSPVCGNGFVEPGEQCDCGLKEKCNNPCCNATTCMLYANASCATGECCDFQTCKPRTAATICRNAEHECDLPEYCTGYSEYCPDDVFKIDGELCDKGRAFCYKGNCRSHSDQCRVLWGPSGISSDDQCYKQNTKGDRHGNCGYNRLNQSYIKCTDENTYCGMLQCKHFNERLEFGMESVAILSHSFINSKNSIVPCRTAIVDLGLNEVDPGLAPDGAKCGENKMCYNQKCMPVEALRHKMGSDGCEHNCYGNGICNSKGHCHCKEGFAPPLCIDSGVGGSIDSGPAENPNYAFRLSTVFLCMMLTLIPLVLILFLYSYYIRRSPSYFWKRNQRRTVHCEKSVQIQINRDDNNRRDNVGSTIQSLLPTDVKIVKPNENGIHSSLRDNLIGNFRGFSIVPLSKPSTAKEATKPVPIRPAPSPAHAVPVAAVRPMTAIPIKSCSSTSTPSTVVTANEISRNDPSLPLPNVLSTANRPLISSPVLDDTTSSTVKQLINKNLPIRPAPPVPSVKGVRPSSTPCILDPTDCSFSEKLNAKEHTLTLNRIASFISKSQVSKAEERKEPTLSQKAAKIDKDTLKSLVISDPIPLNEPSIPVNPLPLSKEQEKSVVLRAQSLRQTGPKQRPGIQSSGSVRLMGSRRPTSIPACSRPTSPPPQPPQTSEQSVRVKSTYDCLAENESEDNIYAVIEEHPVEDKEEKVTSAMGMSFKSQLLDTDDGLLKEIVNEIQARNIDSIYSNDDVKNSDSKRESSQIVDSSSCNQLYENILPDEGGETVLKSSSSSEYLKPIPSDEVTKTEVVSMSSPLKVPEKTAPSYKPFSTSKKPMTPITSVHVKHKFSHEKKDNTEKKLSQDVVNSSQEKSITIALSGSKKSSVSSVVSKFNTANVLGMTEPFTTKSHFKNNTSKLKMTSAEKPTPKSSTVASIQKKFEVPQKPTSSSSSSKGEKPNFKR